MTAQFFGTEFEKIKSSNALAKVVENLELVTKWGVDKETAIRILKGIVNTQNIRGTDLISITVRHTDKEDARNVTAEVARAYKAYRTEIESRDADKGLYELNKAVRDQEDKVEERRKVLATIVRTKGSFTRGRIRFTANQVWMRTRGRGVRSKLSTSFEQEKMQLESQINSLLQV